MKTSADMPCLLTLNGKSAGRKDVREAVERLRDGGLPLQVRVTWEGGDAARHVAEAMAMDARMVIAGGGDGSLNEVVNALMEYAGQGRELPSLAVLPLGTANDFATSAGIPLEPGAALAFARACRPRAVDVLKIEAAGETRWCVNLATAGFGTQVTVDTDPVLKRRLGGLAYLVTGLGKLGDAESANARVRGADFEWRGDYIAMGIGNGRQAGGGNALCPEALIDDARIDLTLVPPPPEGGQGFGEMLSVLGTALASGSNAALAEVAVCARSPWLALEADAPFVLNLDGEPFEARAFRIECVPKALRLHLPPDSPLLSPA
ncbi:lipid kinase YegS [Lysobacter pythonis]|uniref:Probable lipid kinase YegS-like n=1 Tax=Solilutibacter pythonis TaxID=2483112 RepID=A0A3M2HZP3_9GAMM|nr:lipid kinase YegS [Lysobacter pythonis]RMH93363.1 lipid kinase YegS [Lysobacter pythonis]